jgi:GLPGLI family protein
LALASGARAQDSSGTVVFIHAGTIEFERKENVRNQITGESDWIEEYRKNSPEYRISYYNLSFSGDRSLFQPGRENPDNVRGWDAPASSNIVYTDRSTGRQVSQKSAYGSLFLEDDTARHIHWRITADTRTIAGFECHRATAIIMDSVFVVAFYTDEIIPSAGPESFGGLPGMILGLVIPKVHSSWYATKVVASDPKPMAPPKKGKKVDAPGLYSTLQSSLKDWGDYGQRWLMRMMI